MHKTKITVRDKIRRCSDSSGGHGSFNASGRDALFMVTCFAKCPFQGFCTVLVNKALLSFIFLISRTEHPIALPGLLQIFLEEIENILNISLEIICSQNTATSQSLPMGT